MLMTISQHEGKGRGEGRVDLTMVATLKAIIDTGTVSKAAEVLGVTQPSVSQTLRRLRQYFGDELFVRSGNTLHPTPRAIALAPLASRLLHDLQLMSQRQAAFDPATAQRQFVLYLSADAEFVALPRMLTTLMQQAPGCSLRGRQLPVAELHHLLESGEVDLATGNLHRISPALRRQLLGEYHAVCVVSATGRWAHAPLDADAFAQARHVVVKRINNYGDPVGLRIREAGIHRSIAIEVANHFVAAEMVSQTDWITTVASHMAVKLAQMFPVTLHPLPLAIKPIPIHAIWHERFHRDPGHAWLRGLVRQAWVQVLAPGKAAW